ncbi:MAG: hypothetical protein EOM35_08970, partial [Negativicutes bacterium]|nr:hypothetical protein [Negativicutes bacterium]
EGNVSGAITGATTGEFSESIKAPVLRHTNSTWIVGYDGINTTSLGSVAFQNIVKLNNNAGAVTLFGSGNVAVGEFNASDYGYKLDVNGGVRLGNSTSNGLTLWNGTKGVTLTVDESGNLKLDGNVYATGEVSAYGAGSGTGGGSGLISSVFGSAGLGGSYLDSDFTNTFNAYTINLINTNLTSALGRIGALETSTPNVAWGNPTSQYSPLTINSITRNLSVDGHSHDYLPLSGGIMTGALNFGNNIWNNVGDDAAIGDKNIAGQIGIKALNTVNPGIAFYNNSNVAVGNLVSNAGILQWSNNTIWHDGNDGAGSGLNADLLDGYHMKSNSSGQEVWGYVPLVEVDGTMQVGRYIDFNHISASGIDYNVRLHTDGTTDGELFINSNKLWHAGNLSIGAENLFNNRGKANTYSSSWQYIYGLKDDEQITVQIWCDSGSTATVVCFRDNGYGLVGTISTTTGYGKMTYTVKPYTINANNNGTVLLVITAANAKIKVERGNQSTDMSYSWSDYLASNVASATKLANTRTIWGQNFNGEGNVDGVFRSLVDPSVPGTPVFKILRYPPSPYGLVMRGYDSGVFSLQSQRESNDSEKFSLTLQPLGGNVGIGTTDPQYKLDVNGTGRFTDSLSAVRVVAGFDAGVAGSVSCSNWFRSNGTSGWYSQSYGGGIYMEDSTYVRVYGSKSFWVSGNIVATGEITAYSASDVRLKSDIQPLSNSLCLIEQMNPVSYTWNDMAKSLNPYKGDGRDFGLIAQELECVMPELVHTIYGGQYKSIDYIKIIPHLIVAIKQLKMEVDHLKKTYY